MRATGFLLAQQHCIAGPAVRFGYRFVIVHDESQNAILQVVERTERSVASQFLPQRPEPDLDLIQPTAMLRRVDEANAMTLVGQKISSRFHRLQNAMAAFHSQIGFDLARGGNVHDQRFADMRVQVVRDETPRSSGVGANQAVDVFKKVCFGSSRPNQGRKNLASRNVQIAEQPQRSMTNVFVLAPRQQAVARKPVGGDSMQSLDAGLFVDRDRMNSIGLVKFDSVAIGVADFDDLSVPNFGIVNFRKQPILASMRLNVGPILKKSTPACGRCWERSLP